MADIELVRTAQAADHPCEVRESHNPKPIRTQYHHRRPVYLQNRVYGKIVYGPDLWGCGTDHDSIHAWLDWLLKEAHKPTLDPGRLVRAEAGWTYDWYQSVKATEKEQ